MTELPKRGTKDKPYLLSDEANCLGEISMVHFTNNPEEMDNPKCKTATIVGHHGEISKRKLCPVWVRLQGDVVMVYADAVTGTLYRETGECLTSDVRTVVKWSKWRKPKETAPKKTGRVQAQIMWNEGL